MRTLAIAITAILLPALAGTLEAQDMISPQVAEVLQVQADRNAAVVARDVATLDRIIADDLVWGHSTGLIQNKAEYLNSIGSGSSQWLRAATDEMRVDLYGDVAVVRGQLHVTVTGRGRTPADRVLHTIEVYVKSDGRWQLSHLQSVRLPE